jgi:hypothetical protein
MNATKPMDVDGRRAAFFDGRRGRYLGIAPAVACLCAGLLGCGEDASPDDGGGGDASEVYALTTVVIGTEGRTSYVQSLTSLDAPAVDHSDAIEFAGNVVVEALGESVYVGLAESPKVVRYTADASGELAWNGELSFAEHGLARYPFGSVIVDAHRAFAIDEATYQMIAWDPTDMVLVDSIDIGAYAREGFAAEFWTVTAHEGRVYVPIRYVNWDQGVIDPSSVLMIVDAATLEILGVAEDDRCASSGRPVFTADGDAYVVADGRNWSRQLYAFLGEAQVPPNCVLRIREGALDFDEDYLVTIPSLLGGDPDENGLVADVAGELEPIPGIDGLGYVRVFDPRLLPEGVEPAADFAFWGDPAFPLYRVEFGDAPVMTEVTALGPSSLGFEGSPTDGAYYVCQGTSHAECRIHRVDPQTNAVTPLFTVPGILAHFARLR